MSTTPRRTAVALLAVATIVGASGCSKAAEKASEKLTEKAIEEQTGGKADVDLDGDGGVDIETAEGSYSADGEGNVKIETEDGTFTAGTGEVPAGWPDDVPLPDDLVIASGNDLSNGGEVLSSISGTTGQDPDEVVDQLVAALDEWESSADSTSNSDGATFRSIQLTLDDRALQVTASRSGAGEDTFVNLAHTVTPAGS